MLSVSSDEGWQLPHASTYLHPGQLSAEELKDVLRGDQRGAAESDPVSSSLEAPGPGRLVLEALLFSSDEGWQRRTFLQGNCAEEPTDVLRGDRRGARRPRRRHRENLPYRGHCTSSLVAPTIPKPSEGGAGGRSPAPPSRTLPEDLAGGGSAPPAPPRELLREIGQSVACTTTATATAYMVHG